MLRYEEKNSLFGTSLTLAIYLCGHRIIGQQKAKLLSSTETMNNNFAISFWVVSTVPSGLSCRLHNVKSYVYVSCLRRFLLQFCPSTTPHTPSLLNVVETNPFRHLNHLSLRFVPAGDEQLKKYLAECLIHMKVCRTTIITYIPAYQQKMPVGKDLKLI